MDGTTPTGIRERARRIWPHVTAAFVLVFVVANCVEALPDVRLGLDKRQWKEPGAAHELDQWAKRLNVDRQKFEDFIYSAGTLLRDFRQTVAAPMRPFLDVTGQKQVWAMFVAGSRYRDRFQVRARECSEKSTACDWQVLYERNNDAYRWMGDVLESPRVRSATFRWGWPNGKRNYDRGCKSIARRAFREFPDVDVVQCRFERTVSPRPGTDVSDIEPEWGRERIVRRKDLEREDERKDLERDARKDVDQ